MIKIKKTYWPGTKKLNQYVPYKNGRKHGTAKYYYKNGKLANFVNYSHGRRQGEEKRFYNTGAIYEEVTWKKGRMTFNRSWHTNGQLREEVQFINGKIFGALEMWFPDGEFHSFIPYENGMPHGIGKDRDWRHNWKKIIATYFLYGEQVTRQEYRKHCLTLQLAGVSDVS